MKVAIVGAGLAGLTCASILEASGRSVVMFDKGRRASGRMATRLLPTVAGEASFDYGAQYMTARDPAFRDEVRRWLARGLVAPWPAAGEDAFVGVPAMDAPLKALAETLDIRWGLPVDALVPDRQGWMIRAGAREDGPFAAVVVAIPAEQAAGLLSPHQAEMAALASATTSQPCWTVMAAFPRRLAIKGDVVKTQGIVGWAARNSAKPGREGPEAWVIQASAAWSRDHLDDAEATVLSRLLQALTDIAGDTLPDPLATRVHRWRLARSGSASPAPVWDATMKIGMCGDWLLGPRVENAWISGGNVAEAILATH